MPVPERTLEQRFIAREELAFKEIFDRFRGPMYGVARHLLGDHDLATEAVQIALINAWRATAAFQPDRPLQPWLFAITRRAAIDLHRRTRDRGRLWPLDPSDLDGHRQLIDDGDEPTTRAWLGWQVRSAIERLPAPERTVVRLAHLEDLTHGQIADRLRIPVGTVKSRLSRAHRRLAHLLRPATQTRPH